MTIVKSIYKDVDELFDKAEVNLLDKSVVDLVSQDAVLLTEADDKEEDGEGEVENDLEKNAKSRRIYSFRVFCFSPTTNRPTNRQT